MDVRAYVARFMVHKVGAFGLKERVLCFTAHGFSTYDADTQQLTNTWTYSDVDNATPLDGETDFVIFTPRHRIKKTVYRCHYRMEVLVCLMRLRSQHRTPGRNPELQSVAFPCIKFHRRGLQSPCVVEVCPDGVYQRDEEGELVSCIPYTSLVSIDLICDDHNAIVLNHSDNSSLFVVSKRTEMAQAIHRVMKAYGMAINEYRKKTMDAAIKRNSVGDGTDEISFQYRVTRVSATNKPLSPRVLSVTEKFIAELGENDAVISSRPLARIFSLVMFADSAEAFEILFVDGIRRTFYSTHREKLLTELLASCHATRNTQVDIVTSRIPEALRMVPCKIIQSEGGKLSSQTSKELNVMDRELRVVQASIMQQMATYGASKTAKSQRRLPTGLDEGFHALALEFNANTPTTGVIAQPNKPFEKAIFYVAREIRDVVLRHGPRHAFLVTYLQSLYRLLNASPAMKEFVGFLAERGDSYVGTLTNLLVGRHPIVLYWTLMILQRLLDSKTHKIQVREMLLSSSTFLSSLLALFDLDPKTQRYLSDLPVMRLCQFVLCLIKTNPERQLELSKTLHEQLARRSRMLHRILFGFPGLATVEACVGILGRMTKSPSSVHFEGDASELSASTGSLVTQTVQAPPLSMGFGEHMTYETTASRHGNNVSSRRALVAKLGNVRSTRMAMSGPISTVSAASDNGGIAVQNPEVLLRQYRLFLESSNGPKKQALDLYSDPAFLRLRYRCRNVFLQELMSHLTGSFDDFKRVFSVECYQFSGFLGKASGQREKSDIFLTPRALIAVRVLNRNTHEFEFRSIQRVVLPVENRDVFAITVKGKYLYVYSDSRAQIVEKMRELAGVVGIRLTCEESTQVPKPTQPASEVRRASAVKGWDPTSVVSVVKRSGRHGFFRFRKKQIVVINGMLFEFDKDKLKQKSYSLKDLRRVVSISSPHLDHHELSKMIALDFADGRRVAYLADDDSCVLANLYDGCLYCQNIWVTLSPEFSRVNPRLTNRSMLRNEAEKALFLSKDGMFVTIFRELAKDFEKLTPPDSPTTTINTAIFDKALFGLENLNLNVDDDDFSPSGGDAKLAQVSFRVLFQGLSAMLKHAVRTPIRFNEISIILEAFCRINDGCYRLASDETHERISEFISRLLVIIDSGDQLSTLWAIRALHSLSTDNRRSPGHKQAEKAVRGLILGHEKLMKAIFGLLEKGNEPLRSLAVLDFLYEVCVKGRPSTDNNHFDAVVKRLSNITGQLQRMAAQTSIVGLAVFSTGLLRATLDNTDAKVHQRMCDAALESGLTLRSLYNAFFFPTEAGRLTYRYIAGMWIVHHRQSFDLLRRMLPHGFIRMISTPSVRKTLHPADQENGRAKDIKTKKHHDDFRGAGGSEWFIRRMRQEISTYLPDGNTSRAAKARDDGTRANYPGESAGDIALLAGLLQHDFFLPDVIWNGRMREELKVAMEKAMSLLDGSGSSVIKEGSRIAWNHTQFRVDYPSLADEVVIDNFYLRVLIARIRDGSLQLEDAAKKWSSMLANAGGRGKDAVTTGESGQLFQSIIAIVDAPKDFYNGVYQRWLEMRLRGKQSDSYYAEAEPKLRFSELFAQPAAEVGDEMLMKTLTEMSRAFPSVRTIPAHRVDFLMELIIKSFESREINHLVHLLSNLSADPTTTSHLTKDLHLTAILFLAVLCHRRLTGNRGVLGTVGQDGDEFPVIGLDAVPEIGSSSSIPMTQLSSDSRLALRWMCKTKEESIMDARGPYSPVELHQFLKINQAALQRVVVCCCTIHQKHDSNEHEWRFLHEVPELRWMELLSEPIDSATVGLKALTILRNLVVHEPPCTVSDSGYLVPLPTGKRLLSGRDKVAHLVQLLLVDDPAVRKVACEILLSLGPANGPKLHEFGLFFFIFSADFDATSPDSTLFVEEAKLLQHFHRVQDSRETRAGESYLLDILPEGLIALLDMESAEYFADVFTGRTTDKRVLWSPSMRKHLRQMLNEHIEEFIEDIKRDVAATYHYVSLPPIKYSELSRDVYCSGYFLSTIADGEEASLDAIEEPQVLMSAIEDKWKALRERQASSNFRNVEEESSTAFRTFGWKRDKSFSLSELRLRYRDLCKKGAAVSTVRAAYESLYNLLERKLERTNGRTSDEVIECILLAQLRLLEKFSFQFFSFESKALHLLLNTIAWGSSTPAYGNSRFADLCVQILHRLLAAAPLNIEKLVSLDGAWDILLDMVDKYARVNDINAKNAAFSVLQVVASAEPGSRTLLRAESTDSNATAPSSLRLLSNDTELTDEDGSAFFAGPAFHSHSQLMATAQSTRLCKTLERLLTAVEERQPWQVQKILYGIVTSMCRSRHLQEQLVLSTKLFWRALYLLLSTAEDVARGPASNVSSDGVVALKERDVVESAFHALRALSLGLDGQSKSQGLSALANLLPLEFLDCLDRPSGHDFWMILSTEIREPTCVWNDSTRSELMQLIADHCNHGDDDELLFLESATSYMYDCLKTEPFVGGIYLRILLEKAEGDQDHLSADSLYPTTPREFIESIFVFLNTNRDPTVGIYGDTLPALQVLNVLVDLPEFKEATVEVLEEYGELEDCENESVSVATLGRYLLPFDRNDKGTMSISSRRSLSSYGFMSKNGRQTELDGLPPGMEAEFGNVDYLNRQEYALLILNKICGFEYDLEKMFAPFCRYTWSLQVIADHLDYEQAFYSLSCLAELCDSCLVVAEYVEKSGLWVEILGIAIQSRQHVLHEHFLRAEALREPAFEVLYALLTKDYAIRESMYSGLGRFLPYPIVYQIHLDPSMASKFFDDNHEKSDLIWNSYWRTEVRRKVDEVICRNRIERSKIKRDSVVLDEDDYVHMPENFIAGLYLDNFLARPDPEDLTNPAYNLELLFQEWKDKLHCLMGFDLENPPQFLKDLAAEVEQLTTAMTHILRAPLGIEESIEAFEMPTDILRLLRHCNKHVVAGFPYRSILRIARQLASFSVVQSKDFLELIFCRITVEHPDIPLLVKLLRRVLEARAQELGGELENADFLLKDLAYFSAMMKYLESVVEKKDNVDPKVLSNVNRILRIIRTEQRTEAETHPMSQSFFQRVSARWQNSTLMGINSQAQAQAQAPTPTTNGVRQSRGEVDIDDMMSHRSFDVDAEHTGRTSRISHTGTFNVDDERERDVDAPPRSYMFDGETIQEIAPAPRSFRFVNGGDKEEEAAPPVRPSLIRATYEPVDTNYHSSKAAQYDRHNEGADLSRRASLTAMETENETEAVAELAESSAGRPTDASQTSGMFSLYTGSEMSSSRRFSLLDSWRAPMSNQLNPLLSSLTISRRGRRAAAVYSRRKTAQSGRWFK